MHKKEESAWGQHYMTAFLQIFHLVIFLLIVVLLLFLQIPVQTSHNVLTDD